MPYSGYRACGYGGVCRDGDGTFVKACGRTVCQCAYACGGTDYSRRFRRRGYQADGSGGIVSGVEKHDCVGGACGFCGGGVWGPPDCKKKGVQRAALCVWSLFVRRYGGRGAVGRKVVADVVWMVKYLLLSF